jgi:hypothetical protein
LTLNVNQYCWNTAHLTLNINQFCCSTILIDF